MSDDVIRFEPWEKVLRDTVPIKLQAAYREAVVKFLYWLRETGKAATVAAFKEHLAWKKSYLPPERYEVRLQALRWYYDQGRRLRTRAAAERGVGTPQTAPRWAGASAKPAGDDYVVLSMNDVPPLGKADLGGPPWERKLVARIRELHLAWKTEKTYRYWAWRLVRFSASKTAEELGGAEVRAWLSHLSVAERVSVSTQKQALNAAVFLLREALRREPGDFSDFVRSTTKANYISIY